MRTLDEARRSVESWHSVFAFEAMLERWQRDERVSWGDLFASWVKVKVAPRSPETVRRVIRKVQWIH